MLRAFVSSFRRLSLDTPASIRAASIAPRAFKVMIVSRGHGWGHAVPDMAIADKLTSLVPNLNLEFVSYAEGAEAYRACGYNVLDLQLSAKPPLWDLTIKFTRLLAEAKPDLVIAHEEMTLIPIAKAFNIPSVFITDFFMDPGNSLMQALRHADEVIFAAQPGIYTEPPYLRETVHYVGRAVREFKYTMADRARARFELQIPQDATVVLCQPGAWLESQVPLADLLSAAWGLLPPVPRRLIWLAGPDHQTLATRFKERLDIVVVKDDLKIDRLMVASDVLITKANRMTVYEAASIGLPSISISNLVNWPDDVAVSSVESNRPVSGDSTTPDTLARLILELANSRPVPAVKLSGGVAGAATRIAARIELLRHGEPSSAR
jgi:UDP-N-acetylglucosamine:LPS N-acetylglucosamine transferase